MQVWVEGLETGCSRVSLQCLGHKALLRTGSARRHCRKPTHHNVDIPLLSTLVSSHLPALGVWRQHQPSAYFWAEAERSHEAQKHIPSLEAARSLLSKRVKTLHECFMNQPCVHFNEKSSLAIWPEKGEAENLHIPTDTFLDIKFLPPLETLHLVTSNSRKFLCFQRNGRFCPKHYSELNKTGLSL